MKFDLKLYPVSDDGEQLKDEKGLNANYRQIFLKACAADIDGNGDAIKGEAKFKMFDMWMRVKNSTDTIELSAEDIVFLTKQCLVFPVIVAGQVRDFLKKPLPEVILADKSAW